MSRPTPNDVWSSVPASAAPAPAAPQSVESADDFGSWNPEPEPTPTFLGKLWSKTKQDPFVPIGFCATAAALGMGLVSMTSGDKRRQQLLMRSRVGAQAFTLAAFGYGLWSVTARQAAANQAAAPPQNDQKKQ